MNMRAATASEQSLRTVGLLRENFFDDIAGYIRQAIIASSMPERQFGVIEAEQCRIVA